MAGGGLLVGMRVDGKGKRDQDDFEDGCRGPGGQMGGRRRGLRVDQRDEKQAVDEEGAHEVDLMQG